jgi:hypothetical protein
MIPLAADGLLLFHFNAGELVDQSFGIETATAWRLSGLVFSIFVLSRKIVRDLSA